jgi:hypothetical protein
MPRIIHPIGLLAAAAVLAVFLALVSAGSPVADSAPRSAIDVIVQPDDALDETAATPGVCPVFCATDEFCNRGCATPSLCSNHRCLQF